MTRTPPQALSLLGKEEGTALLPLCPLLPVVRLLLTLLLLHNPPTFLHNVKPRRGREELREERIMGP